MCTNRSNTNKCRSGPSFPYHDLAHFVAEKKLNLKKGFYGLISKGKSIQELSDNQVIQTLGAEAWQAEVITRNLQSLTTGSSSIMDFLDLITWELNQMKDIPQVKITAQQAEEMRIELKELSTAWAEIPENGTIKLNF